MFHCRSWIALFAIVVAAGCGGNDGPDTYAISGKVTYQGNPVTSGLINFRAQGQRPLGGPIQPEGTYQYDLPAGTFDVRIDTPAELPAGWKEGDPPGQMGPRQVPEKFADFSTSGLTATVSEDPSTHQIDFNLP